MAFYLDWVKILRADLPNTVSISHTCLKLKWMSIKYTSSVTLATFLGFSGSMWPVATELSTVDTEHFYQPRKSSWTPPFWNLRLSQPWFLSWAKECRCLCEWLFSQFSQRWYVVTPNLDAWGPWGFLLSSNSGWVGLILNSYKYRELITRRLWFLESRSSWATKCCTWTSYTTSVGCYYLHKMIQFGLLMSKISFCWNF